jgi:superfamily I DNA/RNA helicase
LVANPDDEEAFKRIVNYPARGIGATTVDKIARTASNFGVSLWQVISDPVLFPLDVSKATMTKIDVFKDMILGWRERLQTEDLKKEFDFVSQACNPDERKRADFFNSLLKSQNREEEAWTIHALDLLSADIYEPGNLDYITASLSSLKDIQKNSSPFFTRDWMKAVLAHHKSVLAKQAVENFLKANPDYPNDLKNNILEAAWTLLKQEPYVEKEKPIVVKAKTTTKKRTTKKKK